MPTDKIFKENLTSQLLQKETSKILKRYKNRDVCEIGCGDGNISNYLIINSNNNHFFYLSDISNLAIEIAKKKIKYEKVKFKTGSLLSPWGGKKFDLIISDVSSINQTIAEKSPWYKGIKSNCGIDGLKNVKKIIKNINFNLKSNGTFIIPIISLSNTNQLRNILKKKFKYVKETKKVYWPIPSFFNQNINLFDKLLKKEIIYFEKKFGIYLAYTSVAICQKLNER